MAGRAAYAPTHKTQKPKKKICGPFCDGLLAAGLDKHLFWEWETNDHSAPSININITTITLTITTSSVLLPRLKEFDSDHFMYFYYCSTHRP